MRIWRRAAILGIALIANAAANAATLNTIQGNVLVSRGGSGYQPVSGPTQLGPGDSVIVNPGGSAQIVYDNGVTVQVQPGNVVTVDATPPGTPPGDPGAGIVGGVDGTTLLIGGLVVAGVAGGIVALSSGGGGSPASP